MIAEHCREQLDFIVELDAKYGDGVRVIQDVVKAMHNRLAKSLRQQKPLVTSDTRQDILGDFESRTIEPNRSACRGLTSRRNPSD